MTLQNYDTTRQDFAQIYRPFAESEINYCTKLQLRITKTERQLQLGLAYIM